MKAFVLSSLLFLLPFIGQAQDLGTPRQQSYKKGQAYFYWGWNWGWYTKSDIHFKGNNYDFTLIHAAAKDRQSPFDANLYFNPTSITIPQYNFRMGYFIKDNLNVSFGIDHMKYVATENQNVNVSGNIHDTGTIYDGTYNNTPVVLVNDFLHFEHTDGLNYINVEVRRMDEVLALKNFRISFTEGFGAGALLPRTNATLLNNARHDEFHLSGYGLSGVVGLNIAYHRFFVQSELKGGFINMPDIRTTVSDSDKADQHFFFAQSNIVVGMSFQLGKKSE